MITIGVVIQRYGKDISDGAENIARNVAERLAREGFRIIVYTTCARDSDTWRNEFSAGKSILHGVLIRRFPVLRERNPDDFESFSHQFFATAAADRDEQKWLETQGPYCPDLIQTLVAEQKEIDLFFFFSCLHYPTVTGVNVVGKPLVLFPLAQDRPPLYLTTIKTVLHRPQALFFLTQTELELTRRLFSPPGLLRLVRSGINIQTDVSVEAFRRKYLLVAPYLLYIGPINHGLGLEAVFEYYLALKDEAYMDLLMIGRKQMNIPPIQGLKYLGQTGEMDKMAALQGAVLFLQPSLPESFSNTLLESFSLATPVLVNRRFPALLEHAESSGAGMAYENMEEFLEGFRRLYRRPGLRRRMGVKGLDYVRRFYSWEAVLAEVKKGINEILEMKV